MRSAREPLHLGVESLGDADPAQAKRIGDKQHEYRPGAGSRPDRQNNRQRGTPCQKLIQMFARYAVRAAALRREDESAFTREAGPSYCFEVRWTWMRIMM